MKVSSNVANVPMNAEFHIPGTAQLMSVNLADSIMTTQRLRR